MFSILHCTAYECNMCGSNSLPESDGRPIADCPECMAKICWATGADPCERYEKLAKFCGDHGLRDEAERYAELAQALKGDSYPSSAVVSSSESVPAGQRRGVAHANAAGGPGASRPACRRRAAS
jgi:hypothetical protein